MTFISLSRSLFDFFLTFSPGVLLVLSLAVPLSSVSAEFSLSAPPPHHTSPHCTPQLSTPTNFSPESASSGCIIDRAISSFSSSASAVLAVFIPQQEASHKTPSRTGPSEIPSLHTITKVSWTPAALLFQRPWLRSWVRKVRVHPPWRRHQRPPDRHASGSMR